jgi:hypothetical protein
MKRSSAAFVVLVLVAGCGTTQRSSTATTAESAGVSESPASSAVAAAPTSFDAFEGGPLPAGTYQFAYSSIGGSESFPTLAFTFSLGSGWEKVGLEGLLWGDSGAKLGFAVPDNVFADPCDVEQGLLDPPPGPTIDEMTLALFEIPGWEAREWEWDRYLGFMGSHFQLTVPADLSACEEPIRLLRAPGWPGFVEVFGDTLDLWLLNVRGTRVLIYTSTPADLSAEAAADLQAVFDSIQITP